MECLVQDGAIGDRALPDWRVRDGFEDILKAIHQFASGLRVFGFTRVVLLSAPWM
jgi:hypothetical protein